MDSSNLNFRLTGFAEIPIVETMRWKAVIVLLAVLVGIVAPPSLPLMTAADTQASLGTLDVCHNAAPALFAHGDMPCMNECSCQPLPPVSTSSPSIEVCTLTPLLLPFQNERPPRA